MSSNNRHRHFGLRQITAALLTAVVASGALTATVLAAPHEPKEEHPAPPAAVSDDLLVTAQSQQTQLHIHRAKELGSDQDEIQVTILGKKYTGTQKRDVLSIPFDEDDRFPDLEPGETTKMAFVNLTTGLEGTLTVEVETGPDGTKKVTDDHVLEHFRCTSAIAETENGSVELLPEEPQPGEAPVPPEDGEKPQPPQPGEKPEKPAGPAAGPKGDGPKGPKANEPGPLEEPAALPENII